MAMTTTSQKDPEAVLGQQAASLPAQNGLKEPKLTLKQKKFLDLYLKTGNGTRSAMEAYGLTNPASAAEIASQNLRKLKNPISTFLEANGLDLKYLTAVLAQGLQAQKLEDLSGEKVPDHSVRHMYLKTASKWLGIDRKAETEAEGEAGSIKRKITAIEFFGGKE